MAMDISEIREGGIYRDGDGRLLRVQRHLPGETWLLLARDDCDRAFFFHSETWRIAKFCTPATQAEWYAAYRERESARADNDDGKTASDRREYCLYTAGPSLEPPPPPKHLAADSIELLLERHPQQINRSPFAIDVERVLRGC